MSKRSGSGLVQDQQVDLLDAELAGGLVEGVQGLVVAVVADPDLGLDEHLGAVEARAADAFADLALVAVGRGGVDVPVADLERGLDRGRWSRSGGVWKTPKPSAGRTTPLFRVTVGVAVG